MPLRALGVNGLPLHQRYQQDNGQQNDGSGRGVPKPEVLEGADVDEIAQRCSGIHRPAGAHHVDLIKDLKATDEPQCYYKKKRGLKARKRNVPETRPHTCTVYLSRFVKRCWDV